MLFKKIFTGVLAVIMVIGMCLTGASAASDKDSKEKKLYFNESTYCLVSRKNIGPLKNILKERFMEM